MEPKVFSSIASGSAEGSVTPKRERVPRMARLREDSRAIYVAPANKSKRKRQCRCGTCGPCRENARWEAIFRQKFADPDYYSSSLPVRYGSPLNSF